LILPFFHTNFCFQNVSESPPFDFSSAAGSAGTSSSTLSMMDTERSMTGKTEMSIGGNTGIGILFNFEIRQGHFFKFYGM